MNFIIAGAGYTGLRVAEELSKSDTCLVSRNFDQDIQFKIQKINLDSNSNKIKTVDPFSVLYTIPPNKDQTLDLRLQNFVNSLNTKPIRFVYLSTSGVYGDRSGKLTDELIETNPQTQRAKKRVEAEVFLEKWCDKNNVRLVILRVSGIYGPKRLGINRLNKNFTVISESEAKPGNRIHISDLVSCCINALNKKNLSKIYNISDGCHKSQTWFYKSVCEYSGINKPREIKTSEAIKTWEKTRLSFMKESRRLDTARMNNELIGNLKYPDPRNGIIDSLKEEKYIIE